MCEYPIPIQTSVNLVLGRNGFQCCQKLSFATRAGNVQVRVEPDFTRHGGCRHFVKAGEAQRIEHSRGFGVRRADMTADEAVGKVQNAGLVAVGGDAVLGGIVLG